MLVLMDDGSVLTAGPDGGDVRSVVDDPGIEIEIRHPVWSPDGRSIAWAELEIGDQGARSRIVTSEPDGSARTEFPVDTGTFYLQWDPTSSRIAYLGNFQGRVGMGVTEREPGGVPVGTPSEPGGRSTSPGRRRDSSCRSTSGPTPSVCWISKASSSPR